MKTTRQTLRFTIGFALIMACGLLMASVLDRTAFELVKEGNKYIVEQSHDKVVQIRSEKSSRNTTPAIWYVVYFDSVKAAGAGNIRFATGTELKFSAGNLVSIRRDVQLLEAPTDKYVEMDASMLTVDSDRALVIALKEPVLESLKVMATDKTLEQGPAGYPVWKISIWANKKNTTVDVKAGEIWVSCIDGKVCKMTVNPGRVG